LVNRDLNPARGKIKGMSDPTARTTATYDRITPAYDQRWISPSPDFAGFRDRFASALSSGDRVADLGCGPGKDSAWFQEHGLKPVGVDRSIEMARLAAARGIPVVVGDLRQPPLAPVDGLWSCASLLHVPADETGPTLRAWHAALRPAGVLGPTRRRGPPTARGSA
jgi:SAM-dependent methyltransferase